MQNISNALTARFDYLVKKDKCPPVTELSNYPGLKEAYDTMHSVYTQMDRTGYIYMSPDEYRQWLTSSGTEEEKQKLVQMKHTMHSQIQNNPK